MLNDRDDFAAAAIGALISLESDADVRGLAHDAYLYADAMLAERAKRDAMQSAPVGPSSTAVDETQGETMADGITDAEIWGIIASESEKYHSSPNTYDSHMKDAIREAIAIDRSRRDAVRRFTAEEVAEWLVSVLWGGIDRDGAEFWHPMIAGMLWSRCLSESHAEEHAADFRAAIIRSLEAAP